MRQGPFFLHPGSEVLAGMTYCLLCFTGQYGHPCALSLRTRRHNGGLPGYLPVMLVCGPLHGMQGFLEKLKSFYVPKRRLDPMFSVGGPGAKSVRMHAPTSLEQPPTESSAAAGEALPDKEQ